MNEAVFSTDSGWVSRWQAGTLLVHRIKGENASIGVPLESSPTTFVRFLNDLAAGQYSSSSYFRQGAPDAVFVEEPPALDPNRRYRLVILNAVTPRSEFVSVTSGGIAFEDPFWAVLAAYAVSQSRDAALPVADNNSELWKRAADLNRNPSIRLAVGEFLGPITGFLSPNNSPNFVSIEVDGKSLADLRERGMQSIKGDVLKFYELFLKRK
jgi:hypothetical protein